MLLKSLSIKNYKSLRDVTFTPSPVSALVGPNSSGKTNFADAIEFLSEVYSLGLEMAISRKGGYENIAFRKQRRSKAPIEFKITFEADEDVWKILAPNLKFLHDLNIKRGDSQNDLDKVTEVIRDLENSQLIFVHEFSFVSSSPGIKADFHLKGEVFSLLTSTDKENFSALATLTRQGEGEIKLAGEQPLSWFFQEFFLRTNPNNKLKLIWLFPNEIDFASAISSAKVHNFATAYSRMPGVPTPNPQLSKSGENLPALVDWLQREHPERWQIVLSGMKEILPTLNSISVQYLHTKTLGLFFDEEGFGRAWGIEDMSDGTVHALSMLVAAVDPRSNLLVIEEPENPYTPGF